MFQKITTQDRVINQIQDNIGRVVNPLQSVQLNSGQLLESVQLTTGANSINHGLGRDLIGWFLTRQRGAAPSVFDTQDSNPLPNLTLQLTSSVDVSVDIWVF